MDDLDLTGRTLDGRYTLLDPLGSGGVGAVFRALSPDGEQVAVKVIRPGMLTRSPATLQRIFREAKAASSVRSGHVVRVREVGVDAALQTPFLVMELLRGESADALVARLGPVDPRAAAQIAWQAAQGLAATHEAGIVHRDIKPANLFLHREGGQITVKVCDFGIAKILSSDEVLTTTRGVLGTPLYMSPEQTRSARHTDERSDIWSLGVALYELLTGRVPFHGITSLAELVVAICHREIPRVQGLAPWVSPALAAALHGALARDPALRTASMAALAEQIRPEAGDGPLTEADLIAVSTERRRAAIPEAFCETEESPATPRDPLFGATLAGRYRLGALLGRGGMGAVYEATGPGGEALAVKLVDSPGVPGDTARQRLLREAQAAARLDSDHVVRVIEASTDEATGVCFIAMERLRGQDLGALLEAASPLDPVAAVRLFAQACEGLSAAHKAGIVHRDIKPANLFLHEPSPGVIQLKICDFGVAKQETGGLELDSLTRTGSLLGSPLYMSPEQAKNARNVDARADLWSLSLSLHQALSGQRPWASCSALGELLLAICTHDVPPLHKIAPWIDPALSRVVHRGLRRDPEERFRSAEELRAALLPFAQKSTAVASLSPLPPERRVPPARRFSLVLPALATAAFAAGAAAYSRPWSSAAATPPAPSATAPASALAAAGPSAAAPTAAEPGATGTTATQPPPDPPAPAGSSAAAPPAAPAPSGRPSARARPSAQPASPPDAAPAPAPSSASSAGLKIRGNW